MNNTRSENMRHGEEGYEADVFERWLYASRQGDQNIWAELEPSLGKIVLNWLRDLSRSAITCCFETEENYVALYHCGLSPREVMHLCPEEWSDIQEITHLRLTILERLSQQMD